MKIRSDRSKEIFALLEDRSNILNKAIRILYEEKKDVILMTGEQPDRDEPPKVKEITKSILDIGKTRYAPSAGMPELRASVSLDIEKNLGLKYFPGQSVITSGGRMAIFIALLATCDPGDEVIVPTPHWDIYPRLIKLAGLQTVFVNCGESSSFKLTPDLLKSRITKKTRVLILNSPNNPTGQIYDSGELQALAGVLEDKDIHVISDDCYERHVFGSKIAPHIAQASEKLRPRVLLVKSATVTYNMPGWRLGSITGAEHVINACIDCGLQSINTASGFSQYGWNVALTECRDFVDEEVKKLKSRRDMVLKALSEIKDVRVISPEGAFYAWVDVSRYFGKKSANGSSVKNSREFAEALLASENLAVSPGSDFGTEGYMRLSFALEDGKLSEGLSRFKKFCRSATI